VLLPGGATETWMMPSGLSEEMRSRLLRPEIVAGPAIYLASDVSSRQGVCDATPAAV
jgi:hypothetical protein